MVRFDMVRIYTDLEIALIQVSSNWMVSLNGLLAQWQSKYINIVVLKICHIKQLCTTVFQ